jgi:hypothetical protein
MSNVDGIVMYRVGLDFQCRLEAGGTKLHPNKEASGTKLHPNKEASGTKLHPNKEAGGTTAS